MNGNDDHSGTSFFDSSVGSRLASVFAVPVESVVSVKSNPRLPFCHNESGSAAHHRATELRLKMKRKLSVWCKKRRSSVRDARMEKVAQGK